VPPSTKTLTIDLLRHGEPEGGEVLRGRIDHELTELGWDQMRNAVARGDLAGVSESRWTHIISSPLKRCRIFAERLAAERNIELQVNNCWQEIDYGDWDGMVLSDWREQSADMFREFRNDMSKLVPPNGEDFLSFKDRIQFAWQQLAELPDGSHVLLITHGGVLRIILPIVLGMPLNRSFPLHIPFASYSRISLDVGPTRSSASLIFHNAAH